MEKELLGYIVLKVKFFDKLQFVATRPVRTMGHEAKCKAHPLK